MIHLDDMLPVWINLLFVLVAQTLLWIFLLSKLFQRSTNETVRSINGCIHLGYQMSPVRIDQIQKEDELKEIIQELKPPTIACNWVPIKKLLLLIAFLFLFVALMITKSSKFDKRRVWTLFFFSFLAYLLEIIFLYLVVLPYKHIDTEEIIYRVTDLENDNK